MIRLSNASASKRAFGFIIAKRPARVILQKINIAKPKDNILYLDIGRWLKKNKKIMTALHKAQVNYGILEEEQMVLKTQVNAGLNQQRQW